MPPNWLYIHLLDNTNLASGVSVFGDNKDDGIDNFVGWVNNIYLDTYIDHNGGGGPAEDYRYTLTADQLTYLNNYTQDGLFGLGFDPDCHYFNDGVYFHFDTQVVPEPATVFLFSSGLVAAFLKRRKLTA